MQFLQDTLRIWICHSQRNEINSISNEQTNFIKRVIELMRDAGSKFSESCQLPRLHQLLLLFSQLLLAPLNLFRCFLQIAHDVKHGFAAIFSAQIGLVRSINKM